MARVEAQPAITLVLPTLGPVIGLVAFLSLGSTGTPIS
jgi:hypothetical protein